MVSHSRATSRPPSGADGPAPSDPEDPTGESAVAEASIEQQVREIICEKLSVNADQVTPETSFVNDIGADSLDLVELIMEFEDKFGMQIPDDKAEQILTVGDAITYIEENKG
ncbi:acyl carrier protein [bacterium]|nr:acyl carrier protein [bacterium]